MVTKKITMVFNPHRRVWTHEGSGLSFASWDPKDIEVFNRDRCEFDQVDKIIKKRMADHFRRQAELSGAVSQKPLLDLQPEGVEIEWVGDCEKPAPVPLVVQLTNFSAPESRLNADADAACVGAYSAKDVKPPSRLGIA